jgi:hypothetical protein
MRSILLTAALLILAGGAPIEAAGYDFIGAGVDSCGKWTAIRPNPYGPEARQAQQWILGFLSGIGYVNQGGDNPLHGVDALGVWAWIDNFCLANPLVPLNRAAAAFHAAHPR